VYIICTYCIHYRLKRLHSPHLICDRGNWNIYYSISKCIHSFGIRHFQSGPKMLYNYTTAYSAILLLCTNCMDHLLQEYSKSRIFSPSYFLKVSYENRNLDPHVLLLYKLQYLTNHSFMTSLLLTGKIWKQEIDTDQYKHHFSQCKATRQQGIKFGFNTLSSLHTLAPSAGSS